MLHIVYTQYTFCDLIASKADYNVLNMSLFNFINSAKCIILYAWFNHRLFVS